MSYPHYFNYDSVPMDDLKVNPTAPPASADAASNVDMPIAIANANTNAINMQPPSYQKVDRPGGSIGGSALGTAGLTEGRTCRICLEEDQSERMIAPCKCKGWSKWVHRDCLDEWRTNERDRAFSKCTECLFEYYMQPVHNGSQADDERRRHRRRKIRFYLNVSRDVCLGTLLLQFVIVALGALIYACDVNKSLPELLNFQGSPFALYYMLGWLLLLVLTGLYGSIALCINGCSVTESLAQLGPTVPQPTTSSVRDDMARVIGAESTAEYYRRARHRRQRSDRGQQNDRNSRSTCNTCYCDTYMCQPIYCGDCGDSGCCDCCDCCGGSGGGGGGESANSDCCPRGQSGGGDSGGGNNDCGGDGIHILLVILLVVGIILALIGFVVGIVITVIAFQRVVQRHIYLLQKRQLVQEFQVMDLQEYDLDAPLATAPPQEEDIEVMGTIPTAQLLPPKPVMPQEDVAYLHKLGLMGQA